MKLGSLPGRQKTLSESRRSDSLDDSWMNYSAAWDLQSTAPGRPLIPMASPARGTVRTVTGQLSQVNISLQKSCRDRRSQGHHEPGTEQESTRGPA